MNAEAVAALRDLGVSPDLLALLPDHMPFVLKDSQGSPAARRCALLPVPMQESPASGDARSGGAAADVSSPADIISGTEPLCLGRRKHQLVKTRPGGMSPDASQTVSSPARVGSRSEREVTLRYQFEQDGDCIASTESTTAARHASGR